MYAQIAIDCQTQKEYVSCNYCIGKENCQLRLELGEKKSVYHEDGKNGVLKQVKLFGEEEPSVLTKLELAKAQVLAKEVESIVKPLCNKFEVVGSI